MCGLLEVGKLIQESMKLTSIPRTCDIYRVDGTSRIDGGKQYYLKNLQYVSGYVVSLNEYEV